MLVLTRKLGEAIMIGDDVEVCVVRIEHDAVKLGIQAPRHLSIYRHEIHQQIKENNLAAARAASAVLPVLRLPKTTQTTAQRP